MELSYMSRDGKQTILMTPRQSGNGYWVRSDRPNPIAQGTESSIGEYDTFEEAWARFKQIVDDWHSPTVGLTVP